MINVIYSKNFFCLFPFHFRYLTERKILDGLSFVVSAGRSVAIVGTSGSGKLYFFKISFDFLVYNTLACLNDDFNLHM